MGWGESLLDQTVLLQCEWDYRAGYVNRVNYISMQIRYTGSLNSSHPHRGKSALQGARWQSVRSSAVQTTRVCTS
jgi:hypothetical protein